MKGFLDTVSRAGRNQYQWNYRYLPYDQAGDLWWLKQYCQIEQAIDQTTNEYIAWCQKKAGPYNPSPIVYGDYLYVLYDRGLLACYHARTGEEVYGKRRLGTGTSAFTSSPWAYDGKLFCLSEDGDTFVIQAGMEFKLLGKNSLGEFCMATPAITHDSLIIRTESHLMRIR